MGKNKTKTKTTELPPFEIQHNDSIPKATRTGGGGRILDALDTMGPNDSVTVKTTQAGGWYKPAKRLGIKITMRRVNDTETAIYRVS